MQDELAFRPERRMGFIFHLFGLGVLALIVIASLWQASQASISPALILYLLPALAAAAVAPLLAYRLYALHTAVYILEREGLRLRWGLRSEVIPIHAVLWIHPADQLSASLPHPRIYLPGAMLGKRRIPGDGVVEYLASGSRNLIFVATDSGGFAISPEAPEQFILAYQRFTELGSLSPLPSRSVYPGFLLGKVWSSTPARFLLIACFVLSLVLLIWVSLSIPGLHQVHLGFYPDGAPGDLVPAARLLLLPCLNFLFLIIAVFLGLFFFRRDDGQPIALILWTSSVVAASFFLFAVYFILQNS